MRPQLDLAYVSINQMSHNFNHVDRPAQRDYGHLALRPADAVSSSTDRTALFSSGRISRRWELSATVIEAGRQLRAFIDIQESDWDRFKQEALVNTLARASAGVFFG
jgi:hypothetical protein